jgi:LacI family transcriptional regulator
MAVSVVLNGARSNTRVSEATRTRIMDVASGLNYSPNAMAQSLKRQKTNTLGVLFGWAGRTALNNIFSMVLLDGIVAGASTAGYQILLYTQRWENAAVSSSKFSDWRTDGVILISPNEHSDVVSGLSDLGVPVVVLSSFTDVPGIPFIDVDNRRGVKLALDHLWELGHRRIACLGHTRVRFNMRERFDAYREWMADHEMPINSRLVVDGLDVIPPAEQAERISELLKMYEAPTAVFAFTDDLATVAIDVAHSLGLTVPGDLSVVGFDDALGRSLTVPKLTTIRQPLTAMGEEAARILVEQIANKGAREGDPDKHIIAPTLIVRESTASV